MLVIIEQTTKDTGHGETVTVLLEKQEPRWGDRPYATHISPDGGTTKYTGHYDMTLADAVKDYQERIRRGY